MVESLWPLSFVQLIGRVVPRCRTVTDVATLLPSFIRDAYREGKIGARREDYADQIRS